MNKIRLAMIGGADSPFAEAHRMASRICNKFELIAGVFSRNSKKNQDFARKEGLDPSRCYVTFDAFLEGELRLPQGERIEAVAVVTPNCFHYDAAKRSIQAGFHVICEKPMTITVEESEALQKIVKGSGLTFALLHTYTGYPMVRQIRDIIHDGHLGDIQRIDCQYYQGWLNPIIHSGDLSSVWRIDPRVAGVSSCMGDIGVHAFNLIEYTTGLQITHVLSDLSSISEDVSLDLDGTVLLRFNSKAKGVICTSQVATGEENNIILAVYGSKAAVKWAQENPNELYMMSDNKAAERIKPGHSYIGALAAMASHIPAGHPEGIHEAIANIYEGAAKSIRGQDVIPGEYPSVYEGVRGMKFIHSVVKSNKKGNIWVKL